MIIDKHQKGTLKDFRVMNGLTIEQAANALGVSTSTIFKWESGRCYPNVPMIKKIEKTYGVEYNQIIFLPTTTI